MGKKWRDHEDNGKEFHIANFPDAIAAEYMTKTDHSGDYDLLADIVRSRSNQDDIPKSDDLVVNLRVGDVIENSTNSTLDLLTHHTTPSGSPTNYVPPLVDLAEGLAIMKTRGMKRITITAASHRETSEKRSLDYIAAVRKFFIDEGFSVYLRLGRKPDDDFVFMCNANLYLPSGSGGYTAC